MKYFGSTREETQHKLREYLKFYGYKGSITDTDSSINIVVNQPGKQWTIFTSFHFGTSGLCDYQTISRCDQFKELALDITLKNKSYQWVRVGENIYLSNYKNLEMLEVVRNDSCILNKISPLLLSRKELKMKRRKGIIITKKKMAAISTANSTHN